MAGPIDASSFAVTHPQLAQQLLPPADARRIDQYATDELMWVGPLGHVWRASVADRAQGRGCPVCSGLQPPAQGRSLAALSPAVAREADGWDPEYVSAGSRVEMPWRCHACGFAWSAEVRARSNGHRACPACSSDAKVSLSKTHPELAAEMLAPFDPADYTHGSKAKVRWRGPVGHEWEATVANRVKGSGCPVCAAGAGGRARRAPAAGGSLKDLYPDTAREADGWDPTLYRAKSSARMPWTCTDCGHHWWATIFARTQRTGCPACARGRRRTP